MLKRILMASLLMAGAAHAADTRPVLLSIKECGMHKYNEPLEAKLGFTVTATGAVTDMHVLKSSGNATFDEQVARCVSGYTYKPASHDGVPVAAPDTFNFHQAEVRDLEGDSKAFSDLERDADKRCHKLYPPDRKFMGPQTISIVVVSRKNGGEVETKVMQSAGEKADRNAEICLKKLVADHEELPTTFSRGIAVDWSHRR
ncbi:TonB family protein [Rhizomicrobium palustre]|uniref:TonB family protein n=2 Tax=Rhizomicrobium palustre TaxID=189966 RepID=A0A846MZE0_9PROT|nr:TonB family protein [Rhizomicrobium palustre]